MADTDLTPAEAHPPCIVVGIDGSAPAKAALRWAATQARLTGARIKAVTCWYLPATAYGPGYVGDLNPVGTSRDELRDVVEEVLGDPPSVPTERVVVEGRPGPTLVTMAEEADLLVVGSRGHRAVAGLLLGSVSEHCATHAHCPVVVIHGDETRGPAAARAAELASAPGAGYGLQSWSMTILPLSEVKARLSEIADEVASTHERVQVTKNGREYVVLMAAADLESMEATLELLADPEAQARIVEAKAEIERGDVVNEEELRSMLAGLRSKPTSAE